jgi:hypothetical protein
MRLPLPAPVSLVALVLIGASVYVGPGCKGEPEPAPADAREDKPLKLQAPGMRPAGTLPFDLGGGMFEGSDLAARVSFGTLIESVLRKSGYQGDLHFDPTAFVLYVGPGGAHAVPLHETFEALQRPQPDLERKQLVVDLANRILAIEAGAAVPLRFEEAAPALRLAVRDRLFRERMALSGAQAGGRPSDPVHIALSPYLDALLVVDRPSHLAYVQTQDVAAWGVPLDAALERARANTRELELPMFTRPGPGVSATKPGDPFASSMLLFPDRLQGIEREGALVVVMASPEAVLFAGDADGAALDKMAEATAEFVKQNPRAGVVYPHRLEGDTWIPYVPEDGRPGALSLANLARTSLATAYFQVDAELTPLLQTRDPGRVVVDLTVREEEGGRLTTAAFSPMTQGTLVPEGDFVVFVTRTSEGEVRPVGSARWADAIAVPGLLGPPLYFPPYRTLLRAPTPEEMAAFGNPLRNDGSAAP